MIYGIGTDILRIDRVESVYDKFGEHFVNRLLMPEEKRLFSLTKNPVRLIGRRKGLLVRVGRHRSLWSTMGSLRFLLVPPAA